MEILAYLTEESFRTLCLVVSRVCHALCPAFKVTFLSFEFLVLFLQLYKYIILDFELSREM